MLAGELEVRMFAEIARLRDDMDKAKGIVQRGSKGIEDAAGMATKALGLLGVGLSAASFVALIKGSIDAMDHLQDLSKTTDIAVETLAGLKVAAKQSGGDLDSIAASINKLSIEMGKSPEKFRALGVSAKDPLKAFQQLSDVFVAIENPQQRAAVMAAALGKSWAGAAPLLAEGSAKIGEMVEQGSKLSGVTTEMAQQADALNDKWVLLGGTGGMLTRMVGPMLPLLNLLAEELLKSKEGASSANDSFSPLKDTLQVLAVIYANLAFMAKTAGNEIAGTAAQAVMVAQLDFSGAAAIRKSMLEEAAKAKEDLEAFEKRIMGAGLTGKAAEDAKPKVKPVGEGTISGFLGVNDKDAERVAKALQDGLDEEIKIMGQAAQLSNDFNASERAKEKATYDERNQILMDAYDREQAAAIAHGEQLIAIEQMVADNKKNIQLGLMDFMGNLASLMNTQSRKLFEVGKIASIASAVMKGYEAAVSSYAAGAKIGGPYLGAAFAAASVLATANLINNIRSQSFGGGSGGGGSVGGAPVSPGQGGSNFTSQPPLQQQPQGSQTAVTVNITGVVTQEVLDQMKDQLTQFFGADGVLIPASSRQAAVIATGI